MRLTWLLLASVWVLGSVNLAQSAGSEQTHNTLPSAGASFLPDLQSFLRQEDAKRFQDQFQSFVVSGGIHGTQAGLTATPSPLVAYPGGYYTTDTSSITYPNGTTCWVAAHKDTTGNVGSFLRVGASNYVMQCGTSTQPATPTHGVLLMKVVTSGGSITAVTDLRPSNPSRLGVFNIKDPAFGARCDAVTDDTAAIQRTIDALPTASGAIIGGTIFIPVGTCLVSSPLVLTNAKGVVFQGASKNGSTIQVSTTAMNGQSIFLWNDVRDSAIRDLTIYGIANGVGGQAPDACIESQNAAGTTITPTNNEFRNLILNACVKGIKFTQTGGDANNDNHLLYDVFATTMSGPALSLEHSQSQGHTLIKFSALSTCGAVKTVGGNYKLIGGSISASVGCIDFEFAAGTYQNHITSIIDLLIEDGAKTLVAAASSAINVFISHLDKLQNPATNVGTDMAWAAVGGQLTITDSWMDLGFPATLSATDGDSLVTLTNTMDSFGTISYAGRLMMSGNKHLAGTLTFTPSGGASRCVIGDIGGGLSGGVSCP